MSSEPGLKERIASFFALEKNWRVLLAAGLLLLACMGMTAGFLIARQPAGAVFFRGLLGPLVKAPASASAPTLPAKPTAPAAAATQIAQATAVSCGEPVLIFAAGNFPIQPLEAGAAIPDGAEGRAYRYAGAGFVFGFGPTPASLALVKSIQPGDLVTVSEADCSAATFTLSAPEPAGSFDPSREAPPAGELLLLFQQPGGAESLLVRGGPLAAEPVPTGAPPAAGEILAEISLIEAQPSADGSTLQVRAAVRNFGSLPFVLTEGDVRLIDGEVQTAPLKAEPALPRTLAAGASEEFVFSFPKPSAPEPYLRIFTAEVLIEGN